MSFKLELKKKKDSDIKAEVAELQKWFSGDEIRWLLREHPDAARAVADPESGTQSIFAARGLLDAEYVPEIENGKTGKKQSAPRRRKRQRR